MNDDYMPPEYSLPPMQMPGGYIQKQDSETVKYRLEVEALLVELEHDLKGEQWMVQDINGEKVEGYFKIGIAKVNDYGAKAIVGEIRKFVGKNTFLSNMDENEINTRVRVISHMLINLLQDKHNDFEIKAADFESVIFGISELLFISLKRAQGAGERESLNKTVNINESHVTPIQSQGGSWWNPFGGRR